MKSYSSKVLATGVSVILTLLTLIILLLVHYFDENILIIIISTIVFLVASYFSILYVIQRFIVDRVKPIYNVIRDLPLSGKKLEEQKSSNNLLATVKYEVEQWAKTQLKEIERLKELEKYRKDFVGNVSHELKTPIFNIQGYVLTLLEGGLDDPKINQLYLKRTEKSIDRMVSIVEDLESITKLESGELKLVMTKFDIVKTVEEVIEMEHWQASESKIKVKIITKIDKPIFVKADKKNEFLK
jgi:two-component system phosphate regulon sensor histidine kinase PhoR